VSRQLERLGVGIVDADRLAREVVEKGSPGLDEIVATFGTQVLTADGQLDREKLSAVVFGDEVARKKLQAITHPRIGQLSVHRITEQQAGPSPYVVYDAPLLVEVGAHKGLDALIVVAAAEATQVARVLLRDGATEQDTRARIAAQLPLARKIEVADYVIENDGTLEHLEQRTLAVHRAILQRFGLAGEGEVASH
jgi:dephospho-CoA kinase